MKSSPSFIASFFLFLFANSPNASAQWVQTNGPRNFTISTMAPIGTDLFFAADYLGIYRSTNNGVSWTSVNNGIGAGYSNLLAVTDSNTASPMLFASNTGVDVARSSDHGQSWVAADTGLPGLSFFALASCGSDLYAGLHQGVFRSTNHGASWTNVSSGLPTNPNIMNFAIIGDLTASPIIFAGTANGLYRSSDKGETWTPVSSVSNNHIWTITASGTNLFAGMSSNTTSLAFGVSRSTDNGLTWNSVGNGLADSLLVFNLTTNGSSIYAGVYARGVFISNDNGNTWTKANGGLGGSSINAFGVAKTTPVTILAGTTSNGVILSTDNGSNWSDANSGLPSNTQINSLLLTPGHSGGNILFAASRVSGIDQSGYSLYSSSNKGALWEGPNGGNPSNIVWTLSKVGNSIFAGTINAIFVSNDSGITWKASAYIQNAVAFASNGTTIFAGTETYAGAVGKGVVISTDNGATWNASNSGMTETDVTSLAISGADTPSQMIFAGTATGVFLSTNNGASWQKESSGLPNTYVISLKVVNTGPSSITVFAGTDSGTFVTTNNGMSWTPANGALATYNANSFLSIGSNLFATTQFTSNGVLLSTDNGTSWSDVSTGLPKYVSSLAFDGTILYAGTQGTGVWSRPLSEFAISGIAQVPTRTSQIQSYPNPFSHSTTVTFSSQAAGYAEVTVVNLLGGQVAQLFSGELSSGEHSITWDAAKMSAPHGMYECIVRMNGQVQQVGMMLSN